MQLVLLGITVRKGVFGYEDLELLFKWLDPGDDDWAGDL